ncbi:Protein CBG27420 [Caenorhabditis briggsae]|uniref:Protein CBG27420 n=2 Tax=Caenorhabditis briggsae TaxID=6238 RepID=B6IJZ7_CAEBR|nr:Protein CBG27420 [Caenorhabditis briggsae]ULT79802.1 hypothetical protein L3Y34_010405 [Caenorhabditis briggsae]CAS00227.1 Protein CBG27420 [Caenorhabditis briggsae]
MDLRLEKYNLDNPEGVRIGGYEHPVMLKRRRLLNILSLTDEGEILYKDMPQQTAHLYKKEIEVLQEEAKKYIKYRIYKIHSNFDVPNKLLKAYKYVYLLEGPVSKEVYVDVLAVKYAETEWCKKRIEEYLAFKYGSHLLSLQQTSREAFSMRGMVSWCWPEYAESTVNFNFYQMDFCLEKYKLDTPKGIRIGGYEHPVMRQRRQLHRMLRMTDEGEILYKELPQETAHLYGTEMEKLKEEAEKYIKYRIHKIYSNFDVPNKLLQAYKYIYFHEAPVNKEVYVDVLAVKYAETEWCKNRIEEYLAFKYGSHLRSLQQTTREAFSLKGMVPCCWPEDAEPKEDFLCESFKHDWTKYEDK